MSNLVEHAKFELDRAGLLDEDSDYNGMLGKAALEIIEVFAKQGHSGYSAAMTCKIVAELMMFKTLTPLTNNPSEWVEVGEDLWQNRRNPAAFSKNGGKTYTMVDDNNKIEHTSDDSTV